MTRVTRNVRLSIPVLVAFLCAAAPSARADVTIHCLDVGQADATLIVSSSGKTLLFDGGYNDDGDDIVVPYMNSLGLGALDYMVASHYHADHVGGLDEVYAAKGVTTACYDRGWDYSTVTYADYAAAVAPKRQTIVDGQVIDLGDGVTVTCLGLNGNGQLSSPFSSDSKENEYCVTLLVECGDFDFFVAGDLTGGYGGYGDIETSIAAEVGELEVYRVNHHGSYSSSNPALMNAMLPEVSIISVPQSSSYGHPHQDALDRIAAVGSYVYQTEQGSSSTYPAGMRTIVGGHIVITSDGAGEYFVNGDQWEMDEYDPTDVPAGGRLFALLGNHPNPFNPATEIRFTAGAAGPARLSVYDLAGRRLLSRDFDAVVGEQGLRWNGADDRGAPAPSGIYLYRVETAAGSGSGRMTLAR